MDLFALATIILAIAVAGFLCYLVITFIPMPEAFKTVIVGVAVILLIIYLITNLHGVRLHV